MAASTYKPPTIPAGRVSEFEYGQYLDDWFADTPTELVYPLNIQTYAAMRRDSSIAAIQQGYTLQLRRAQWQLDGRGCDPNVTQMVADDLGLPVIGEDQASGARTRGVSWSEHLRVALSQSLTFGHSGFALGAEVKSGQARLNVLAERPPWTINEIHVDPVTGAFLGVTQDGVRTDKSPQIPARNMAWYCLDREGANWAGRSMYYSAWLPWLIKREMIRVHASSNRRWGAGVPVMEALPGTAPSDGEMQAAAAMASAARAGEQAGAASPPGFQLKILGLSGAVPDTLQFIEWLDRQITRASLMSHLELGQGSSGGAYALGSAFIDSWVLALETLGESIADTATRQIAARLVEWNFGEDEAVPRVTVAGVGSRREVTAESLQMLLASGGLSPDPALEAWIRREYRLPERAPAPVAVPGVALPGQPASPGAVGTDGGQQPAGASAGGGLVAAALAAVNAADWGALDDISTQMTAQEAAAPAAGDPAPQWAAIANDAGNDWRVDAALARGADVPSAYKQVYGAGDKQALQRGFDVWTADQQIAGTAATGATVDDFKALVATASAPRLTLDLDNRVVAVAVKLGRYSAVTGQLITDCPYKGADAEQTALRRVWVTSYLRLRAATDQAPAAEPAKTPAAPAPASVRASQEVLAAAGHPSACAHATLGSVCHCECAGVRHSWGGGDMPSAVKVPQGALQDRNGTKAPANPAPDGLSANPPDATPSTDSAPTPLAADDTSSPTSNETPPAPPADTRSYDERVDEALDGDDARSSTPLSRIRAGDRALTGEEQEALTEYVGNGFAPINHLLRGGDPQELSRWNTRRDEPLTEDMVRSWSDAIDEMMAESRLPEPIVTWRGMGHGDRLFGPEFGDEELTGMEWREDAFTSTSTDRSVALDFAQDLLGNAEPNAVMMHILVPSGTGAIELSDETLESEALLNRGLRYRVVEDYGLDENGIRYLDVEVIPGDS